MCAHHARSSRTTCRLWQAAHMISRVVAKSKLAVATTMAERRMLAVEFVRFVVVRCVCAIFSYGAYLLLLRWMRYELAYVLAFLAGVGLAYVVSAVFVFR